MTESERFAFLFYIYENPEYVTGYSSEKEWRKIPLIKTWRAIFGDGLKESKEAIEELRNQDYFQENVVKSTGKFGDAIDWLNWTLTDKSLDYLEQMLSIEEIEIELIKWRLLSHSSEDLSQVFRLSRKIKDIWG